MEKNLPAGKAGKTGKPAYRTGKYLKYAIGEIILVMIGILLALQVSNWNQQRIAAQKEQLLLEALHDEFVDNKAQFEIVIARHELAMASTQYVIAQFPIDPKKINLNTFKEKMNNWGRWISFNPSQGVIRSLVNTSSFELISNPELRRLLVSWEDVLADYKEEEDLAMKDNYEVLFPEITQFLGWNQDYEDERVDNNFLSTLQFETIFFRRQDNLNNILGRLNVDEIEISELERIKATIDRIIELSKPAKQ
ncbi:hypothetical protein K8354_04435 [Polaribacter litorisediminis]|uniref:hypothetical protein n=1 Tax=Polaribacter litorisediminis TaxID=1908341 RepID=UPI001CBB6BCC|nr:hypothetical protein [Polaribacter litorisediminis]UAM99078.1 hypothetical protein K8354_04435 [Polaribacter litorisediminis]